MDSLRQAYPEFFRITLVNFLFFLHFACFFTLPEWFVSVGARETVIGMYMGAAGIASLCTVWWLAGRIESLPRLALLRAGLFVMIASTWGMLLVDTPGPLLAVLRMLHGAAFAACFSAAGALAVQYSDPGRRSEFLGLFGIATLLTHALAPVAAEWIVHAFGFNVLFAGMPLFSLTAWGLTSGLQNTDYRTEQAGIYTEADKAKRARAASDVIWLTFFVGASFGSLITFLPVWVHNHGAMAYSLFFFVYSLVAVSVRYWFGHVGDTYPTQQVLAPAVLLILVALLSLAAADIALVRGVAASAALVATGITYGAGHGFFYPVASIQYVELFGIENSSEAMTRFLLAFNVGVTASAFGLGAVAEHLGYAAVYGSMASLLAVSLIRYARRFELLSR